MYIEQNELWRLRRFALGSGLLLFVWSVAGIALLPDPRISVFGLPLAVARPRLFPIGLALAATYGALRYFYYAISLGPSPYRIRRDLLDNLRGRPHGHRVGPYQAPRVFLGRMTEINVSPWSDKRGEMETLADQLRRAFPRFLLAHVNADVVSDPSVDENGNVYLSYSVAVTIPARCKLAAFFLDVDYTAAVWFPALALAYWYLAS